MEVTRMTDYALRMLAELVVRPGETVSVRVLAQDCDVPYSFARSIQQKLVAAGIVQSTRGSKGGISLAIDPEVTTVRQIVEAVQGKIALNSCDVAGPNDGPCERRGDCPFNPIWCDASRLLTAYLDSVSLADAATGSAHPHVPPAFIAQPDRAGDGVGRSASDGAGGAADDGRA